MHFKPDSSTLWHILWVAFQVRHPRTAMYRAAVQQRLRVMNTTGHAPRTWSTARWYQRGAAATESVLRRPLREIGWEIVDMTVELRQREGRPTLQLPWDTWASTVPGADVAVYTDAGARQDSDEERGCGVGLVIRVSDKWCWAAVPLETWVEDTTAELLGVVLWLYVVECLRDLGAWVIEQTYDTQAVAAFAEKPPEQQKHPVRRALKWSVGEAAAAHWGVKFHQEVLALTSHNDVRKMGNILADA